MTTWSPQQNEAISKAGAWMRLRYSPFFYLAGYAGSGKTTLAIHLASHAKGEVAFAAFTGKAARVMRSKGCAGAKTIHSLIYHTSVDPDSGKILTKLDEHALDRVSLVVIDECSMVNAAIGTDLLSFDVPILVLGDPAQLPPVSGAGFFTNGTPDYMLTEVHRQAAESPIIRLATDIRQGTRPTAEVNTDGLVITRRANLEPWRVTAADAVLVGRNDTRQKYNARLRELAGIQTPFPRRGEPLICLRNDKFKNIFNGDIFTVAKAQQAGRSISMTLNDPEDSSRNGTRVSVLKEFFKDDVAAMQLPHSELRGTQQFTFGYAITCHKAQGSQWSNVCVFDESSTFRSDGERWLYTAVTRAADHLTLVI